MMFIGNDFDFDILMTLTVTNHFIKIYVYDLVLNYVFHSILGLLFHSRDIYDGSLGK